jgi:hypothetical protein
MKRSGLLMVLGIGLLLAGQARAEGDALVGLPLCRRPVAELVRSTVKLGPRADSDAYASPGEPTVRHVVRALQRLLEGDSDRAFKDALVGGYWLCRGEGKDEGLVLGAPAIPNSGHGVFVWRADDGARPMIVEAPHPRFDLLTERQGLELFAALRARVFIVASTHRCASTMDSGCDGDADICGRGEGPPESDMAHALGSVFMGVHQFFAERFPEDLVVSLHGMGKGGISVSDGTTFPTHDEAPVARFAKALQVVFPDEHITSCNEFTGAKVDQRLCGTTNVQGRHVNGIVVDACSEMATKSAGRFLHIEQSLAVRKSWERMADAFEQILHAEAGAP